MRIFKKLILLLLFLPVLVFSHPKETSPIAEAKTIQQIQEEIEQYEREVSRLRSQANTLSNQIARFNAQIRLTTLKIAETQEKILLLGGRIDQLEVSLETLTEAFSSRASETYKMTRLGDSFIFLISAPDLSSVFSRYHYLQRIQEADRDLLMRLQKAQGVYQEEKTDQEDLQEQLEIQRANLDNQKAAKGRLLQATKNDEKKYQELLEAARADLRSIERALSAVGAKIGDVNKGEVIAIAGNSGCSTGPHLHFEVFENAKVEGGRVVGTRTNPHKYLDNGQFQHPLPGSIITADYDEQYLLGIHTGIDFAYRYDDRQTYGASIYAAEGGVAYLAQDSEACYLTNTVGRGVIIDHQNGLVTLYWHIP